MTELLQQAVQSLSPTARMTLSVFLMALVLGLIVLFYVQTFRALFRAFHSGTLQRTIRSVFVTGFLLLLVWLFFALWPWSLVIVFGVAIVGLLTMLVWQGRQRSV